MLGETLNGKAPTLTLNDGEGGGTMAAEEDTIMFWKLLIESVAGCVGDTFTP
jgi:hypothetical protein